MTETITRRRRFAQIPDALIMDRRVSAAAVRVWARLDRYAGADGSAFPGRERLAADLDMSLAAIKRALAELTTTGWITREARDGQTALTHLHDEPRTAQAVSGGLTGEPGGGSHMSRGGLTYEPGGGSHMSHKGEPGKESHQGVARRGRAAPAELPLGIDQAPPAATDTQAVVAAFAAEVQRRGGTATPQWRARVGRDAKRLLADGVPVADLVEAAVRAGARGRADLDAMLASPTGQSPRPSDRERLYAAWDGIAAVAGA